MTKVGTAFFEGGQSELDTLFRCLSDRDCRRILSWLHEQAPDPVTQRELASFLCACTDTATTDTEQLRLTLHHTHLPALDTAGLLEWDPNKNRVSIANHPSFEDQGIIDAIREQTRADSEPLDFLFEALANARRRRILNVLSHQLHSIHLETLAREVCAAERDVTEQDVSSSSVEQVLLSLRHHHLPVLSRADLVTYDTYDAGQQMVAYEGHPALRAPWLHSVLCQHFRASLTNGPGQEIGQIEGRGTVVSFCQELGQQATDELFCLFTNEGMLEAGCFSSLLDASHRGVDVYIGVYDPAIREHVRKHMPGAVLWEPDRDWLHLPVEGDRLGRLLLVDRETVMLTTRSETGDSPEEQALIGEGADNILVVMVQQMLQSHPAVVDDQSAEMALELPF